MDNNLTSTSDFISSLVRPTMAISFTFAIIWLTIVDRISGDAFLGIASAVITFYVGVKTGEKTKDTVVLGDRRVHEDQPRPVTNSARTRTRRR